MTGEKNRVIESGCRYFVFRNDGKKHAGEVVESRKNENTGDQEYYVHFDGMNRRLDEWVPVDRISNESPPPAAGSTAAEAEKGEKKLRTRIQKRRHDVLNGDMSPPHGTPLFPAAPITKEQPVAKLSTPTVNSNQPKPTPNNLEHEQKVKYIDKVQLGDWEIDTWYYSPYPEEYSIQSKLWICEFCLKYMKLEMTYRRHLSECEQRQPPGRRIYAHGGLAVYEVDGAEHKLYAQCLCLLAKLFLDHKTLYFDVEPFLFYVLTEVEKTGSRPVGYFSKEKQSADSNNVACILTLPPYQRKGYGKFLIALSYELSRLEGIAGSPEKPLSDLGKLSYRSYWTWALLDSLRVCSGTVSIAELSRRTGIISNDIVSTLQILGLVRYWKGQYVVSVTPKLIEDLIKSTQYRPPPLPVVRSALHWTPLYTNNSSGNPGKGASKSGASH